MPWTDDPAAMSPPERRREIASILAGGVDGSCARTRWTRRTTRPTDGSTATTGAVRRQAADAEVQAARQAWETLSFRTQRDFMRDAITRITLDETVGTAAVTFDPAAARLLSAENR